MFYPVYKWNENTCLYSPAAQHHRTVASTHFPSRREGLVGLSGWLQTEVVYPPQSREWVDGSWVMGQMGHENRMGHMGHGSLGVDP